MEWAGKDSTFAALLVAHAVALVLLGVVLVSVARLRRELSGTLAGGVLSIVALSVVFFSFVPSRVVPIDWITVLQEGREKHAIFSLYARGSHAGEGFWFLTRLLADGTTPDLRDVVRMNWWLGGLSAIGFFMVARAVLAKWWTAALFALAFVANLVFLHATFSELPSHALTVYLLASVPAGALAIRHDVPIWTKAVAVGLLGLLAALVALVRPEVGLLLVVACGTALAPLVFGVDRVERASLAVRRFLLQIPHWPPRRVVIVVVVLLVLGVWLHGLGGHSGWIVEGLHPLNPSFLTMPGMLWLLGIPLGVVVLFTLGMVHALRHFERFLLLPVSVIVLYRAYFSASHLTFYELFRYMTLLTPTLLFLALFGWRELGSFATRAGWSKTWRPRAAVVMAVLMLVPPLPGLREHFQRGDYGANFGLRQLLVERDLQLEVRYLMRRMALEPECVFAARTAKADYSNDHENDGYVWVLFGQPLNAPTVVADDGTPPERLVGRLDPTPTCARIYRGRDCNLKELDGCKQAVAGRRLLDRLSFEALPYNDIPERGETEPVVHLELYSLELSKQEL